MQQLAKSLVVVLCLTGDNTLSRGWVINLFKRKMLLKILLIDDHQLFLEGVRYVLSSLRDGVEVDEATNANRGLQLIDRGTAYSLILVDIELPGLNGFAFLEALRERKSVIPAVVLSSSTDARDMYQAISNGALGYIPKAYSSNQMLDALNQILMGHIYIPEEYQEKVNSLIRQGDANQNLDPELSERKLQVLKLLAEGYSNKEIAMVLGVTEAAIKSHIGDLLRLFQVKNRTACIAEAKKRELIK